MSEEQREAIALAARYHDLGKAHPVFAASLEKANPDHPPPEQDTVWAKSPGNAPLRHDPKHFRHELASALLLCEHRELLLDGVAEQDLLIYLALAHHGKVRLAVRAKPDEPGDTVLGVRDFSVTRPASLPEDVQLPATTLSLTATRLGAGSLADRALDLRDRHDLGPFRLAFCEAVVRVADWRASRNPSEGP